MNNPPEKVEEKSFKKTVFFVLVLILVGRGFCIRFKVIPTQRYGRPLHQIKHLAKRMNRISKVYDIKTMLGEFIPDTLLGKTLQVSGMLFFNITA